MTFGSLFAGIGGFDLGFERAGMTCKWQVEIDPYCQRVLAKHWPNVRRHDDVRTFPPEGDWGVDVICGGFPCQDISNAGTRAGIEGERSGLWSEIIRTAGVLRPRFIVVENVAAIIGRGMGTVLGDLASLGFDAEWEVLPAKAFGSPQRGRDRMFLVAYPAGLFSDVRPHYLACPICSALAFPQPGDSRDDPAWFRGSWKNCQPDVLRVVDGLSDWVDSLRAIGNSIVPQVAEWIGRRLMEATK
jgi:DNA (cytosine-5)-methyltransferase 1